MHCGIIDKIILRRYRMNTDTYKLGLGIDFGITELSADERIKIIADAGFDSVFSGWRPGTDLCALAKTVSDCGLIYQSVHAPFGKVNLMWEEGEGGDAVLAELCRCVRECADAGVGIVVSHVWIGFCDEHPNETGVRRFSELVRLAESLGVKIAFENTEGELYLARIRDSLFQSPAAGFCIDTGHEMCYNGRRDMINAFGGGGKLFATHLNDNFGKTGQDITWYDDSHLIPFDGSADWENIAKRLSGVGYNGILTCELKTKSKPERDTHRIYEGLDCAGFVRLAHKRAAEFAAMLQKYNGENK